ncbi:hypothetical protein, partial [Aeromonas sanarellii]
MAVVSVRATVVEDNTGIKSEMPILLTEQGELGAVTDYLLKMEADGKSISMMKGFIRAVTLLLNYMDVNQHRKMTRVQRPKLTRVSWLISSS